MRRMLWRITDVSLRCRKFSSMSAMPPLWLLTMKLHRMSLTASKKRQLLIRQKVILSGAAFPPKSIRGSMFLLLIKLEETWMALLFFDFCKTFSQTKISSKLLTISPLNLQYPVNRISSYSRRCMIPFVQHK